MAALTGRKRSKAPDAKVFCVRCLSVPSYNLTDTKFTELNSHAEIHTVTVIVYPAPMRSSSVPKSSNARPVRVPALASASAAAACRRPLKFLGDTDLSANRSRRLRISCELPAA